MDERDASRSRARSGLAGFGIIALAVGCCAAIPFALALAGGLTAGAWLGIGAGILAFGLIGALFVYLSRRRTKL